MRRSLSIFLFVSLCSLCRGQSPNYTRMLSGVNYQTGTSYALQPADVTRVTSFANTNPVSVCLSSPFSLCSGVLSSSGAYFGAGTIFSVTNTGAGTVTITCSGCTINGSGTLALSTNQGADIYGDGVNFAAVLGGNSSSSGGVGPGTVGTFAAFSTSTNVGNAPCNYSGLNVSCSGNFAITGLLAIGASPPTACGSASDCIASGQGSTAGTPTSGQNYFRSTSSGWVCSVNGGAESACLNYSGLPGAQTGDTYRFNVNGDTAVDAVNGAVESGLIYALVNNTNVQLNGNGFAQNLTTLANSVTRVYPTATDSGGVEQNSSSSASLDTVIGWEEGSGTTVGQYGFGSFYRWSLRFAADNTTNARYWFGLAVYNTGGSGGETAAVLNTTKFATNNPNVSMIGFRFSAGTDTTWQGVTQATGGSQTFVSSSVAIDTNPHTFEFASNGTTVSFYIDHVLIGSSTTNLPSTTTVYAVQFLTGDNENTANAVSGTTYHALFSIK
jgi:hypothetical protein